MSRLVEGIVARRPNPAPTGPLPNSCCTLAASSSGSATAQRRRSPRLDWDRLELIGNVSYVRSHAPSPGVRLESARQPQ
jgi:hypothetical protein